jgi:hypothetical protein
MSVGPAGRRRPVAALTDTRTSDSQTTRSRRTPVQRPT